MSIHTITKAKAIGSSLEWTKAYQWSIIAEANERPPRSNALMAPCRELRPENMENRRIEIYGAREASFVPTETLDTSSPSQLVVLLSLWLPHPPAPTNTKKREGSAMGSNCMGRIMWQMIALRSSVSGPHSTWAGQWKPWSGLEFQFPAQYGPNQVERVWFSSPKWWALAQWGPAGNEHPLWIARESYIKFKNSFVF